MSKLNAVPASGRRASRDKCCNRRVHAAAAEQWGGSTQRNMQVTQSVVERVEQQTTGRAEQSIESPWLLSLLLAAAATLGWSRPGTLHNYSQSTRQSNLQVNLVNQRIRSKLIRSTLRQLYLQNSMKVIPPTNSQWEWRFGSLEEGVSLCVVG